MACDHALAECLQPGEGVVRLYGWSVATVSFGKNERAVRLAGEHEVDYVRRPTGGRAVLHADEVTYSVVAPVDAFGGLREAYVRINRALAAALRALGADVEVVGDGGGAMTGRALPPDAGPCFQAPAAGEIVSRGRKLVGSAQARFERVLLQPGSILLQGSQRPLAPRAEGVEPITLRELLGPVSAEEVSDVMAESLRVAFGGAWIDGQYHEWEREAADELVARRYRQDAWTWRR